MRRPTAGFGSHTITTHEHNGHNPAESDGYAAAFFFPGEFYDYHWPMILAGHDSINTGCYGPEGRHPGRPRRDHQDPRRLARDHEHALVPRPHAGFHGAERLQGQCRDDELLQRARSRQGTGEHDGSARQSRDSRLWLQLRSENVNLCLPSGTALDWGNRDYDVNLLVADKAWDQDGQLFFNIFNLDGFLGDVMTVNWLYKPYLDVRARKYRFRILNGSVSRYFKIALVDQNGNQVPFYMIANDGNIMEHAVPFPNAESPEGLPEQGIAERYDIIVDFSTYKEGDKLYLVNLLEHEDGRTPEAGDTPRRCPERAIPTGSPAASTRGRQVPGVPGEGRTAAWT